MKLLFVCSGNTCRSPLAEAIARQQAAERGLDIDVSSAGISAWEGAPASDGALLVGMEHRADLGEHRSRPLTREIVDASDLIDRKSTRLNSSHANISYAVFCLKKKTYIIVTTRSSTQ